MNFTQTLSIPSYQLPRINSNEDLGPALAHMTQDVTSIEFLIDILTITKKNIQKVIDTMTPEFEEYQKEQHASKA